MYRMDRARSPYEEQRRRPRPALRPAELTELAARFALNIPEADALQAFARTLLRDAMRHVNAAEVEERRIRAMAAAFKRQRFEVSAPARGGRQHG